MSVHAKAARLLAEDRVRPEGCAAVLGLCRCGCGERTNIATRNEARRGHVKGLPQPFVQGHTSTRGSLAERFEAKVDRSPGLGPNGDCHLWTAATTEFGYGVLTLGGRGSGQRVTHRIAWFLATGAWPDLQVLHSCDTPACVRFDHLFLGTQADNMADMHAKGRAAVGEEHGWAKLTKAEVRAIRASEASVPEIVTEFGVSRGHVYRLRSGGRWAHLDRAAA